MRVAWLTDIHLNFLPGRVDRFLDEVAAQRADALFISGDIGEADTVAGYLAEIAKAVSVPVYFVLGNHDFYHGSITEVRDWARRATEETNGRLVWLQARGIVTLAPGTAVVGVDGWADGRLGEPETSAVVLSDWFLIREIAFGDPTNDHATRQRLLTALRQLGDADATALAGPLESALRDHATTYVVTHVPPWAEAAWHEGRTSAPDWLPWFSCAAVGRVILAAAERHPERKIVVLCGHTHGAGEVRPRPNLHVITGGAVYGAPVVQRVFEV